MLAGLAVFVNRASLSNAYYASFTNTKGIVSKFGLTHPAFFLAPEASGGVRTRASRFGQTGQSHRTAASPDNAACNTVWVWGHYWSRVSTIKSLQFVTTRKKPSGAKAFSNSDVWQ